MEGRLRDSATGTNDEKFEPTSSWVREEDSDTLLLFLPGFKKEQIKIQLTPTGTLKISGKRPLQGDERWSSFYKEFQVPSNCDIKGIAAKFESNTLYVKQPKLIIPVKKQDQAEPSNMASQPPPRLAEEEPTPQKKSQPEYDQKPTPMAAHDTQKTDAKAKENLPKESVEARNGTAKTGELTDAKRVSEKAPEEEKQGAGNSEKVPKKEDSEKRENAAAKEKYNVDGGKAKFEDYRQAVGGLATRVRSSKKAMNLVVLALMAIVLGIYVKNWLSAARKIIAE